jgi:hypothetical protein
MRTAALTLAAAFVLASCASPDTTPDGASDAATDATLDGTSSPDPIVVRSADLEWADLDPEGAPGVQLATLWGDPGSSGFGAFFRLPAGFAAPLHTHTHPMKVVIVSGTYIQQPDGEPVFRLGPGSYLMQPGGDYRHTTSCDDDEDCVFFVESDGPFDLFVAEEAAGT